MFFKKIYFLKILKKIKENVYSSSDPLSSFLLSPLRAFLTFLRNLLFIPFGNQSGTFLGRLIPLRWSWWLLLCADVFDRLAILIKTKKKKEGFISKEVDQNRKSGMKKWIVKLIYIYDRNSYLKVKMRE